MQTFSEKFNEVTNDKYKSLKLRNAKFIIEESLLLLTFAYPERDENTILSSRDDIILGAKRAFDGDVPNIEIKLNTSIHIHHFFFYILYSLLLRLYYIGLTRFCIPSVRKFAVCYKPVPLTQAVLGESTNFLCFLFRCSFRFSTGLPSKWGKLYAFGQA